MKAASIFVLSRLVVWVWVGSSSEGAFARRLLPEKHVFGHHIPWVHTQTAEQQQVDPFPVSLIAFIPIFPVNSA